MLNFPIEHVQEFLMLMWAWINRRIQIANGAVLMRMEVSKPRPHRNFYFFKSRKERPSQQAVKLIYLYNPWKACSGIVGPICFSKRQEISGESVIIYGFKAADGFVNIFDTTAALFDLFYLFPISCRLFYLHKKNVPPGTHQWEVRGVLLL